MKVSKHFNLQELVDKETFQRFGGASEWFLDPKAVAVLEALRSEFGGCTVNDWSWGGQLQYRGFRPIHCEVGGKYSQHRFGRAFDCNFKLATPDEVRSHILRNQEKWLDLGLTTIEDGKYSPTWLHMDIRKTNMNSIFIVKP